MDTMCYVRASIPGRERQVLRMGKQPGREPGRAGAEPETLWEEGWEMRPVMGGDGVWDQVLQDRVWLQLFRARKSLAALSQREPWSQAALLRMQEWGDQVGNHAINHMRDDVDLSYSGGTGGGGRRVKSDYILKDLQWIE